MVREAYKNMNIVRSSRSVDIFCNVHFEASIFTVPFIFSF